MNKFTPGPWKVEPTSKGRAICAPTKDVFGLQIVAVTDSNNDEANARLIAAAPSLYSLVEKLRDSAVHPESMELLQEEAKTLLEVLNGST